ncbi:MAG: hypothetical protein LBP83_07840 [Dysgonamonadaceae bacterium]|jgi:hypothetical protein|nr:hypothetical protein [Dysgonamonadaceae bacterium]
MLPALPYPYPGYADETEDKLLETCGGRYAVENFRYLLHDMVVEVLYLSHTIVLNG